MNPARLQNEEPKPGFLLQIFGTELALWGFRTETLNPGLLGRWPRLAAAVERRFKGLDSVAAALTLRVFRAALLELWEEFEPARYNSVHAAFRFFEDFVQVLPVLTGEVQAKDWNRETRDLQMSFVRLLEYRDHYDVLMTDFVRYLERKEQSPETVESVKRMLGFITGLTFFPPTFKNIVIARHSLPKGELQNWERIKHGLEVAPANLKTFEAPDNVEAVIFRKIEKLRQEQEELAGRIQEVRRIEAYLNRDESGLMKATHLESSVDFLLENVTGLPGVDRDPLKWQSLPHRLLFAVFKDIELNFIRLLGGALRVREGASTSDVFIFQPACFKSHMEAFSSVMGALQRINRQSADIEYTFESYAEFAGRRPDDPLIRYVHDVSGRALAWFRAVGERLDVVLRWHEEARGLEERGKAPVGLSQTKELPFETFPDRPRFLPYFDRPIVARYHLNGKSVREALDGLLGRLYQCRYRFREKELVEEMNSLAHFQDQARRVSEELERLGVRA